MANGGRLYVGLQFSGSLDGLVSRHVGRGLALFWPARKPDAHAADMGEAEYRRLAKPLGPYQRNDDFTDNTLKPIWQWNHVPDKALWSLTERPGALRLHTLSAKGLWDARNSLTQRAIGRFQRHRWCWM